MIVYTCPKCGENLRETMIATYPPIPRKECPNCGWEWEGPPEIIEFKTFNPKKECIEQQLTIYDYLQNSNQ